MEERYTREEIEEILKSDVYQISLLESFMDRLENTKMEDNQLKKDLIEYLGDKLEDLI